MDSNGPEASRLVAVLAVAVAAIGVGLLAAAIATNDDDAALPPRSTAGPTSAVSTTTITTRSTTTEAPITVDSQSTTSSLAPSSSVTTTTEPPPERNLLGGDSPEDRLMPDVVCFDLQDAQDEVQDHGVFFSRSEDASGDGRRQLWDRNWVVVDQDPAPGTPIGEGDAVFFVLKDDEDHGCDT